MTGVSIEADTRGAEGVIFPEFHPFRTAWIALVACLILVIPAEGLAQGDGILDVKCNVDGAVVFVDGELIGEAPILEIVPAGRHVVMVERDAYESHRQEINLAADTTVAVIATLSRVLAGVDIQVDVEDAEIFLDGQMVGKGSVTVDPIEAGEHMLVVDGGAYGRYEGPLTVRPRQLRPVIVKLRGSLGAIDIATRPDGARVELDGKDYGLSPTTVEPLPPGKHSLRLSRDGMADQLIALRVEPGQTIRIDAELSTESGALDIRPTPRNSSISVNGVELGSGRQVLPSLAPGSYSIRASAVGHTDFVQSVEVEAGGRTAVSAALLSFDYQGPRGGGAAGASVPVHKRPGLWVGVGAGAAAVVAGVIVAVVASSREGGGPEPIVIPGTDAPPATYVLTLP